MRAGPRDRRHSAWGYKKGCGWQPFLYPHAESNRNRQNRNLKFYPLNYRDSNICAKIGIFYENKKNVDFCRFLLLLSAKILKFV